jgi:hypothetical protein
MTFIKSLCLAAAVVFAGCSASTDPTDSREEVPSIDQAITPSTTCLPVKIPDCGDLLVVCGHDTNGCRRCGCG